jgi:hypothetical protein
LIATPASEVPRLARSSGIAGVAGGLCLVVGDVLITPLIDGADKSLIEIRAGVATSALYLSGLLGATSVLFYVFAAWHAYLALRPAGRKLAAVAVAAFAAMLTSTGIYHAVFIAQNFGAKVALTSAVAATEELALSLPAGYSSLVLSLLVIPSAVFFTLLSGYAILSGRSLYPRWFVVFNPLVVLAIYSLVTFLAASMAPVLFSFTLAGNVYNLAITAFFVVSTALLWNARGALLREH